MIFSTTMASMKPRAISSPCERHLHPFVAHPEEELAAEEPHDPHRQAAQNGLQGLAPLPGLEGVLEPVHALHVGQGHETRENPRRR